MTSLQHLHLDDDVITNIPTPRRKSTLIPSDFNTTDIESNAPTSQQRSISSAMSYAKRSLSISSRPESVIERLRIESSDDGRGAGITIGGTFISANCSIILVVMASIFMVVGTILTAISYRPRDYGEEMERFMERQEWSSQLKIIGPIFVLIGALMAILGLTFCILGWQVNKAEQRKLYSETPISQVSSVLESPFMPTISQALMRNPSFPLIVPQAQWKTPQVNLQVNESDRKSVLLPSNQQQNPRPRSSSVQIPFMGGTIVPSSHIDQKIKENLKKRRNSLPAHYERSPTSHRSRIAFVINEVKKSSIKATPSHGSMLSRLRGNLSRSSTNSSCTEPRTSSTVNYNIIQYHHPIHQPHHVAKDIACFPTSTWNDFNPKEVPCAI